MITAWAVPAPLPAYIGVSQTTEIPVAPDFADTLGWDRNRPSAEIRQFRLCSARA
jgi:hypothetical protein